ncbi:hypothetical protein AcW1_006095 [Taiwanofungus camphoratus]|nr:hypothetical protein AcW2_004857 [Antrodia cinnamomea]KAI0950076.1 hypothetical protein AcV7_008653 [Antrodia cinnamomea]KAI0957832.1 hypothetical protein AcW1_006095 [Antrodia cinnamomea]
MVRQNTRLVQRLSPYYSKLASARYANRAPQKSSIPGRLPFSQNPRTKLHTSNTNRFLKSRSYLPTIHEETLGEEQKSVPDHTYGLYQELDALARDEGKSVQHQGSEDEDDLMEWDEETTLVAMLQESYPGEDEQEELMALVDKLKAPMSAQGAALKQYMVETIVPVITRVKEVHGALEDKVDLAFGTGLLTFDEVCKKVEAMAIRDEDELRTAYVDCQDKRQHLLVELEHAYNQRGDLWLKLQEDLDKCGTYPSSFFLLDLTRGSSRLSSQPG